MHLSKHRKGAGTALLAFSLALAPAAAQKQKMEGLDTPEAARLVEIANEVVREVEELRGAKFKRAVEKGVYTEAQLRRFLEKKIFDEEYGKGRLERMQWYLTQLGFLPQGTDLAKTYLDVLLSQIGGFYDPDRSAFFMLERAAKMGDFLNRMMIAHELTHALDDQLYGLDARMKKARDHDEGFAIGAVIEGSATALMFRWNVKNIAKADQKQMAQAAKEEMKKAEVLASAPPYFHVIVARYMAGANFIGKGRGMAQIARSKASFLDAVTKCFDKQPLSSEQILHSEKYWKGETRDEPATLANAAQFEAALVEELGGKIVERDTMGEIHLAILARNPKRKLNLALASNAASWTTRAAKGWDADELWMLEREDGERGMLWVTVWDTPKDREEFEKAYEKHYGEGPARLRVSGEKLAAYGFGFVRELGEERLKALVGRAEFRQGEERVR